MNGPFKVGDVCTVVYSTNPNYPIGVEVTILAIGNQPAWVDEEHCYEITNLNAAGMRSWAPDRCLKKKPPPAKREELGSWDLCPNFERKTKLEKTNA